MQCKGAKFPGASKWTGTIIPIINPRRACAARVTRTFNTLASIDVYKLGLTQQCLFLDSEVGSGAVAELLSNPDSATLHLKQAKVNIIKLDWKTSVEMAAAHSSTSAIIDTNWLRVWEEVRDHGTYWTSILIAHHYPF